MLVGVIVRRVAFFIGNESPGATYFIASVIDGLNVV